jgi:hypothetical protein
MQTGHKTLKHEERNGVVGGSCIGVAWCLSRSHYPGCHEKIHQHYTFQASKISAFAEVTYIRHHITSVGISSELHNQDAFAPTFENWVQAGARDLDFITSFELHNLEK